MNKEEAKEFEEGIRESNRIVRQAKQIIKKSLECD
jgi:hypothetical protein